MLALAAQLVQPLLDLRQVVQVPEQTAGRAGGLRRAVVGTGQVGERG